MSTAENQTAAEKTRRVGHGRSRLPGIIGAVAGLALLVAMGASTKWLNPAQVEELTPKAFNATTFAAEQFPQIQSKVAASAVDVHDLARALASNVQTAGEQYGVDSGSGKFTIPVRAEAEVDSVDSNWILLDTPDIDGFKVRIPVGTALSGNPIRDVTGEISFGDFTDQTTYQSVANELKLVAQREVLDPLQKDQLPGRTIIVHGAFTTGGAQGQIIIQPVQLEVQ